MEQQELNNQQELDNQLKSEKPYLFEKNGFIKPIKAVVTALGACVLLLTLLMGISSGLQERLFMLDTLVSSNDQASETKSLILPNEDNCIGASQTDAADMALLDDVLDDLVVDPVDESPDTSEIKPSIAAETRCSMTGLTPVLPQAEIGLIKQAEARILELNLWLAEHQKHLLALFLTVALLSATFNRKHLALNNLHQTAGFSVLAQLISSGLVAASCGLYADHISGRNYLSDTPMPYLILAIGFALNLVILMGSFVQRLGNKHPSISFSRSLLSIPIYAWMILLPFLFSKDRDMFQLALMIGQMLEMPLVYLQIGLYIWLGMMIKHSHLADLLINQLLDLRLKAHTIAILVVVIMAIPTAFTGASGIIILAVGLLIFQGLEKLELRKQFVLAITAMSGSTGVVLSPSLMIVAIAFLNKEVTTDELFFWGTWIFALTVLVLLAMVQILPKTPLSKTSHNSQSLLNHQSFKTSDTTQSNTYPTTKLAALTPYLVLILVTSSALYFLLGLSFNEFTAPYFLVLVMLSILVFERRNKAVHRHEPMEKTNKQAKPLSSSFQHSGAILLVMLGSYTLGSTSFSGEAFASNQIADLSFTSQLFTLLLIMILIGMILDPFGALILVSIFIAPFAYELSIHPIHFWMMALISFELGYVTPPVAMNHLLTRQQLPALTLESAKQESYKLSQGKALLARVYLNNERVLLPIMVLGSTLLLVTFAPLAFY